MQPVHFLLALLLYFLLAAVRVRFRLRQTRKPSLAILSLGMLAVCCASPQPIETSSSAPTLAPIDSVEIHYAQGFSIHYQRSYPMLLVHGTADTARYALLPTDVPRPEGLATSVPVIRTPVQRIVTTATTHLGLIELLDARDRLVGIGQADLVYDETIQQKVQQGTIQEVSTGGSLNVELILSLRPDLVMVSATPGVGLQQYQPLRNAGIPVIVNAEWMEASPLGKAEWVKLMAVLLRTETLANQRFDTIANAYDSIAQSLSSHTTPSSVIVGSPFRGTWYVPGRNSYLGQLLRDAQVQWPWEADTSAVSFNVALETVYPHGLKADYWINPGQARQLHTLAEQDERLTAFRPYRQGKVYNHYRRVSESGGNDYYESGTVRPDLVLADLVEIFHPEVLGHALYYYQKLE